MHDRFFNSMCKGCISHCDKNYVELFIPPKISILPMLFILDCVLQIGGKRTRVLGSFTSHPYQLSTTCN